MIRASSSIRRAHDRRLPLSSAGRPRQSAIAGGEREEDVARAVRRRAPPARAMPRPARWASRSHWWGRSGASVARTTMMEPAPASAVTAPTSTGACQGRRPGPRGWAPRGRDRLADRDAVDPEQLARAVVGLDQGADREAARGGRTTRDAVPIPPLNSWQIIPVPPPTLPSATGPPVAASSAVSRCSGRTWKPLMSLRRRRRSRRRPAATRSPRGLVGPRGVARSASCTTPTRVRVRDCDRVVRSPDSRTHSSPVSSPLPLRRWQPAKSGSMKASPSCGTPR